MQGGLQQSAKQGAQQLNGYLRRVRHDILESNQSVVYHVVTGNEASDCDSIVSALMYAYFQTSCGGKDHVVPVMSIPRQDLRLRCETNALLQRIGIDIPSILFADEVNLAQLHHQQQLKLILTDHNVLCADRQELHAAVDEILDHHQDMGEYPHVQHREIAFDATAQTED